MDRVVKIALVSVIGGVGAALAGALADDLGFGQAVQAIVVSVLLFGSVILGVSLFDPRGKP